MRLHTAAANAPLSICSALLLRQHKRRPPLKPPSSVHCVTPRVLLNTPPESMCGYRRRRCSVAAAYILNRAQSVCRSAVHTVGTHQWPACNSHCICTFFLCDKMHSIPFNLFNLLYSHAQTASITIFFFPQHICLLMSEGQRDSATSSASVAILKGVCGFLPF